MGNETQEVMPWCTMNHINAGTALKSVVFGIQSIFLVERWGIRIRGDQELRGTV